MCTAPATRNGRCSRAPLASGRRVSSSSLPSCRGCREAAPRWREARNSDTKFVKKELSVTGVSLLVVHRLRTNQALARAKRRVLPHWVDGRNGALREILDALRPHPAASSRPAPAGAIHPRVRRTLNETSALAVKEAGPGDKVLPGRELVAPGNRHLIVVRRGPLAVMSRGAKVGQLGCRAASASQR
jgi:hypothetical protein